jgi:DeoR/GlpR family transcriptional regulator of sugar metabolism
MRPSARNRHEKILAQVYTNKEVMASSLAEYLSVSEATIRRDLRAMADEGKLELVHGGAVIPKNRDFSYRSKAMRNVEAKQIIGRLAGNLVADGDQVFLDSGTTCFEMVPSLKRKKGVLVIVNSARLALELDTPNLKVILLGGQYRPDRMDTIGPLANAALDQLRWYTAFIGADGLSMEFGLTASDVESAHMYRRAVENAREVVLLADHSKFQAASLCKIVDWEPISRIVTDRQPDEEWMSFFAENQVEVIYPSKGTDESGRDGETPDETNTSQE